MMVIFYFTREFYAVSVVVVVVHHYFFPSLPFSRLGNMNSIGEEMRKQLNTAGALHSVKILI